MRGPTNDEDGIVWLASYPRSGNTWIRAFLHAYMGNGTVNINDMTEIRNDTTPYYTRLVSGCDLKELDDPWKMFWRGPALFHQLVNLPRRPAMIKTHFVNRRLWGYQAIPKEVTHSAIYVARDPRDVCVSFAKFLSIPLKQMVEEMNREGFGLGGDDAIISVLNSWSEHVSKWTQEEAFPVHIVKYEDMHENSQETFSRVLGFLKIEPDPDRVTECIESASLDNLKEQEAVRGFAEAGKGSFFGRGRSGAWGDVLPKHLEKKIIEDHGEAMRELNYLPQLELVGEAIGNA